MKVETAREWLGTLSEDDILRVLVEYHTLKQELCAQVMGVPTGCDDWVDRAVGRGKRLRNAEHELSAMIHKGRSIFNEGLAVLEKAEWRTKPTECANCRGTGYVSSEQMCAICKGTGTLAY